MPSPNITSPIRRTAKDLLPNEQEISYQWVFNFLKRYKRWIIGLIAVFLCATIGFVIWLIQTTQIRAQAHAKFAAAKTPEDWQAVTREFPRSDAALFARLTLADHYFQKKEWLKALPHYQAIVNEYPFSDFKPSALIGMAAVQEATEKMDEALKTYQSVTATFPDSFQAPQAKFAAARLLESNGRLKEARQSYEELITRYPISIWKNEATASLTRLGPLLKASPSNITDTKNPKK